MRDRVALLVGGSDGIGREAAFQLMAQGVKVAVVGRTAEKLERFQRDARPLGEALVVQADVTEASQVDTMVEQVLEAYGRIDILVNAQGGSMGLKGTIETIPLATWNALFASNLTSVFLCCQRVIPHMKKARWGRIINLSSIAGRGTSFFGSTAYAAAKAGVIGFSRQASVELGPYNITINVVAPGVTETDRIRAFWAGKSDDERQALFARVPLGRLGQPKEAAAAITFLASEEAGYVTGAVIDVNGGYFVG